MNILVLEIDPRDAQRIALGLEQHGIATTLTRAGTRAEFVQALKTGGVDVVLVDRGVPDIGRIAAIALSRARRPEVPVIVHSGEAVNEEVSSSLSAGASDYVLKDRFDQLTTALRRNRRSAACLCE